MSNKLRIFDLALIAVPLLLLLIGLVVLYTVTFPSVQFTLARSQAIYAVIGIAVALSLTFIDYRNWQNLSFVFYGLGIVLLITVFYLGSRQFGASRWIDLGIFQLQPSEILKLVLILTLARLLSLWKSEITLWRLLIVLAVATLPVILVFRQPDLGTAGVLMIITFGLLFFAGMPWRWWLAITLSVLILLPLGYTSLQPYQKSRIQTFLTPASDPRGTGYNVRQATIAIGSGGLFGQGLGRGSQSQLNFLPVVHTDFIFAGLAEATGLLGAIILLALYFVLLARIFRVAELSKDSFGMYVALGIAIMLGFQIFVNVGMNLGVIPVTGIPLPFVSFGGTSLIVNLAAMGILQSIYARHKKITF